MKKETPYLGIQYVNEDGEVVDVYAVGGGYVGCYCWTPGKAVEDRSYHIDDFNRFFTLSERYSDIATDNVSRYLREQHDSE